MPVVIQTICDGCGMVKKEANHWYTVEFTGTSEVKVRPMGPSPTSLDAQNLKNMCGRRCIAESLDRWMDQINQLTAQSSRQAASTIFTRRRRLLGTIDAWYHSAVLRSSRLIVSPHCP